MTVASGVNLITSPLGCCLSARRQLLLLCTHVNILVLNNRFGIQLLVTSARGDLRSDFGRANLLHLAGRRRELLLLLLLVANSNTTTTSRYRTDRGAPAVCATWQCSWTRLVSRTRPLCTQSANRCTRSSSNIFGRQRGQRPCQVQCTLVSGLQALACQYFGLLADTHGGACIFRAGHNSS